MANNIIPINNASKEVDAYIPFGGEVVDLGEDAMVPSPEYPLLQYATGLPAQRPKRDNEGREMYDEDTGDLLMDNIYYAGFFTQYGVDKALDDAMIKHNIPWLDIVHGGGEVVRHWSIEKPSIFLMAKGIPNNAYSKGDYGIAYLWRAKKNSPKSETVFYAHVVIRQLLPDYAKPFNLTLKSTQTNDILNAMRRQYKVLAKARESLRRINKDMALPIWSYSFLLGPSKKQEQRGQEGASKTIFPIISGIPDDPSSDYLKKHEVPIEFAGYFREMVENAVEWSKGLTERIAAGTDPQEPWQNVNSDNGENNANLTADEKKLHKTPF